VRARLLPAQQTDSRRGTARGGRRPLRTHETGCGGAGIRQTLVNRTSRKPAALNPRPPCVENSFSLCIVLLVHPVTSGWLARLVPVSIEPSSDNMLLKSSPTAVICEPWQVSEQLENCFRCLASCRTIRCTNFICKIWSQAWFALAFPS
jgi:hypothetical protein